MNLDLLQTPARARRHENTDAQSSWRVLCALVLFGATFAYVEAAVVAYLRAIYDPIHARLYPDRAPGDLFPIITLEQLKAEGVDHVRRLAIELVREAATLVMLAAAALAVARSTREWFGAFMLTFGVWDVFFYVFLKLQIDWPASLLTWDLLFLLPVPWVGPVLAPVIVSLSMICGGVAVVRRERSGRALELRWGHWTAILTGGLIVVVSFCWDFRVILAGGYPTRFPWPLFALGEVLGVAAFLHGVLARGRVGAGVRQE